ncbi:MAG: BrnA antitoxin family protein [bacterium]
MYISEIPELDEEWFKTAEVGLPLPRKAISLRVEPKVLNWFKIRSQGKGYQTYMNAVLKSYVEAQIAKGK